MDICKSYVIMCLFIKNNSNETRAWNVKSESQWHGIVVTLETVKTYSSSLTMEKKNYSVQ